MANIVVLHRDGDCSSSATKTRVEMNDNHIVKRRWMRDELTNHWIHSLLSVTRKPAEEETQTFH